MARVTGKVTSLVSIVLVVGGDVRVLGDCTSCLKYVSYGYSSVNLASTKQLRLFIDLSNRKHIPTISDVTAPSNCLGAYAKYGNQGSIFGGGMKSPSSWKVVQMSELNQ